MRRQTWSPPAFDLTYGRMVTSILYTIHYEKARWIPAGHWSSSSCKCGSFVQTSSMKFFRGRAYCSLAWPFRFLYYAYQHPPDRNKQEKSSTNCVPYIRRYGEDPPNQNYVHCLRLQYVRDKQPSEVRGQVQVSLHIRVSGLLKTNNYVIDAAEYTRISSVATCTHLTMPAKKHNCQVRYSHSLQRFNA